MIPPNAFAKLLQSSLTTANPQDLLNFPDLVFDDPGRWAGRYDPVRPVLRPAQIVIHPSGPDENAD